MSQVLIDQLLARKAELSKRPLDEMYERPFWLERFGARGRGHADEDGDHHVRYLVEAIAANDPEPLRRYARWLQPLLNTRGMCSRHLDENLERLQRIVRDEVAGSARAVELLQAARDALTYPDGPGRAVQAEAAKLCAAAPGHDPADVADHASYLADAAAMGRTDLFVAYAKFMSGLHARRGAPAQERELLDALAAAAERLPADARGPVTQALAPAREAVA